MRPQRLIAISLASLVLSACSESEILPPDSEEALAATLVAEVEQATAPGEVGHRDILRHLVQAVRENGDATALRMLRRSSALRDSARTAREAGDTASAAAFADLSYRTLLGAIVRTFPNSPSRVGRIVDDMLGRMRVRLGTAEAPRIRRVLRYAAGLRGRAEETERPAVALHYNLTALNVLHRLLYHVANGTRDAEAASQAEVLGITG